MSETKKLLVFSTPVIVEQIDNAEAINAELEKLIEARRLVDQGVQRSNAGGGWHSTQDFPVWSGDVGRRLIEEVGNLARTHTGTVGGSPLPPWVVEGWVNVSGAGASNKHHVHGGSFWSAVYYVRAPESDSGQLLLHDPRMPGLRMYYPTLRFKGAGPEQVFRLQPRSGLIVMFPSWLQHSVEPWEGEGERISIAFNIMAARRNAAQPNSGPEEQG
jgi:uncharacterized protein (TIGR02466 family)